MKIDKRTNPISIYDWNLGNISIHELKTWVDYQIEIGKNKVKMNISWGYDNDIDAIDIVAEE